MSYTYLQDSLHYAQKGAINRREEMHSMRNTETSCRVSEVQSRHPVVVVQGLRAGLSKRTLCTRARAGEKARPRLAGEVFSQVFRGQKATAEKVLRCRDRQKIQNDQSGGATANRLGGLPLQSMRCHVRSNQAPTQAEPGPLPQKRAGSRLPVLSMQHRGGACER